jgi:hypothetical protein
LAEVAGEAEAAEDSGWVAAATAAQVKAVSAVVDWAAVVVAEAVVGLD